MNANNNNIAINVSHSPFIQKIKPWFWIIVGCTIMSGGFVFFINPYNIVPGGVYGASIVLHNIFPSIQVGTFGYFFDIPLMIISVLLLGSKLGIRTIVAAMISPLIMNGLSWLAYPTQEALMRLDPALLCGGVINMTDHLMLTTLIGGALIGVGCGIVVRQQATTGGSDIVAMILQKYAHVRFSSAIFLVDACVILFGLIVIGFGIGSAADTSSPSWHLSFYSLIAIFISSRVLAYTINGEKNDKLIFIISNRPLPELRDYILKDLDRTGTCIKGQGLYSHNDKEILMLVVSYKETNMLKAKIKAADPLAFVIVTDAYDAFGEGWKPLPVADELQPE